jgi:phosphoglycerol transferase MdoB-like AlkP superfamily enzyme
MNAIAMRITNGFTMDDEIKRFLNWVFIWVLLANAGYMALWFIGAPPRWWEIGVIGFTGLIVKRFPFWARYVSFVAVMIYSTLNFVGAMFNLSVSSLTYSIQFFLELKPDSAVEYIIVGISILAVLAIAFKLLRRDTNFSRPSLILAAAALFFGLSAIDLQIGKGMRGHYKRLAPEGALFTSATNETKFAARADGKRNLVLIVVESLGVPATNAEMKRLLFRPYKDSSAVAARYDVSQGQSLYYNSTTAGEVRELCGRWGDYYDLVEKPDSNCIPAILGRKGYNTIAMHSFSETFFQRGEWYPNIGFKTRLFDKELAKNGARQCGGVFAGACDRDIPAQISEHLKQAKQPTFLYWLTLNSHLPVPPGLNLDVDNCARISPILVRDFPQICRQFNIWHDIDTAMVKQITADDFPDSDILIVGDHMPPYFDRHHRTQFDPEHVPYLYLRRKDGSENNTKIASK